MWILLWLCLCSSAYATLPLFDRNTTADHNNSPSRQLSSVSLHYRKASEVMATLTQQHANLLTEDGSLLADDHSNHLWVREQQNRLPQLLALIHAMDTPQQQISIAVKMMVIDTDALQALGLRSPEQGLLSDHSTPTHHAVFDIKELHWWLDHLDATIAHGSGQMIASPTLLVGDHNTASIESGQEVPYQERTHDGDISTSFKNATLHLDVRPDLLPKDEVMLSIHLHQDKVSELSVAGMPAIQTEKINTTVRAKNHHTIVLGGVYTHRLIHHQTRVAFLERIPFVGKLFQHTYWTWHRQELMIFVTPHW